MDAFLIILSACLLLFTVFLYGKNKQLFDKLKKMTADISEIENIGNLLSVTESTLEEAAKTIATAKQIMDERIRRMESLLKKIDESVERAESIKISDNVNVRSDSESRRSSNNSSMYDSSLDDTSDPDAQDRAYIAQRNKEIIMMLGDDEPLEVIAKKTGASIREIHLIKKFI